MEKEESYFVGHESCPNCGSSDNLARYSDGHGVCFGCDHYEHGDKQQESTVSKPKKDFKPIEGDVTALKARRISHDTCKKFGYMVGIHNGTRVQLANYRDTDRNLIGQKIRGKDKAFSCVGNVSNSVLFGMHLWNSGRKLVITEGEIDCLSYAEVTNCKYPVVSLPNGAQSAKKTLINCKEYLEKFDEIVLLFDDDDAGRKAVKDCLPLMGHGKILGATVAGHKDANEALKAGDSKAIVNAVFNGEAYKPSAVVTVDDIFESAMSLPEMGLSYPWPAATQLTLGIRRGEVIIVGAAPKIGKTEHQHQLMKHMTDVHKERIGVMSLEEKPVKTAKKIAGKYMNKQFTKPPEVGGYTLDELHEGLTLLRGKIEFYSSEGVRDYEEVLSTVRYWAAQGIWFFIIDPLTALVAEHDSSTANDILNEFMSKASAMAIELNITFFMYSHVNPVKSGTPHDQGGEVLSSQFTGSRAMEKWAHYGWGICRNRNEEDPVKRNTSEHVLLFDREFGEYGRYSCFYDTQRNDYHEVASADACPEVDDVF